MIDLDELQRLHEAATPGTWEAREHLVLLPLWNRKYPDGQLRICPSLTYEHQSVEKPNAALIAAARNALPALLRLARRARQVLGAAELAADAVSEQADALHVSNDDARYLAAMKRLNDALDALRDALAEGEGE